MPPRHLLRGRDSQRAVQPDHVDGLPDSRVPIVDPLERRLHARHADVSRDGLKVPDDRVADRRRQRVIGIPDLELALRPVPTLQLLWALQHAEVERDERVRNLERRRGRQARLAISHAHALLGADGPRGEAAFEAHVVEVGPPLGTRDESRGARLRDGLRRFERFAGRRGRRRGRPWDAGDQDQDGNDAHGRTNIAERGADSRGRLKRPSAARAPP